MPEPLILAFVFALGACVGSFLNVVVWRLPRQQSLVSPPSRCTSCGHRLAWYDNVPVFGWLWLGGRCRYCKARISIRYPIVEAVTGAIFVVFYIAMFDLQWGPCRPTPRPLSISEDWPIYGLYMFLLACLLAASLIDAELYVIPLEICLLLAGVGLLVHVLVDSPTLAGNVIVSPAWAAVAAGGTIGWLLSLLLLHCNLLRRSFPDGEPLLEADREAVEAEIETARRQGQPPPALPPRYTFAQILSELFREILFLLPGLVLAAAAGLLVLHNPIVGEIWARWVAHESVRALLGALLGALVGGLVVWVTRILGTIVFRRVAMGLGDVHLMFGVGAVIGAGPVVVAFFLAPFFGMLLAVYMLLTGKRREIPYGPYLSLGTAASVLFYCRIADWLQPGLSGLGQAAGAWLRG
ncbi:MAG: prepilin peptidase [Phycisphaerae bacterium]|nr:prepilin peptidase [Phycisphaerae bacterium]